MRVIRKIKKRTENVSIKTRMLVFFIFLTGTSIVSVGIIFYSRSSDIINNQSILYADTILGQVIDRIEKLKEDTMSTSIPLLINPLIQSNDFKTLGRAEFIHRKTLIESELHRILSLKREIASIYMYVEPDIIFSVNHTSAEDNQNIKQFAAYRNTSREISLPAWTGAHVNEFSYDPERHVLAFSRPLYDKTSFQPIGALIIYIPVRIFAEISSLPADSGSNIFIIDRQNRTVFNGEGSIGNEAVDRGYIRDIAASGQKQGMFRHSEGNDMSLVKYTHSADDKWIYIAEVPQDYLVRNSQEIGKYMGTILVVGLLVTTVAVYFISAYFTVPLREMIRKMKIVEQGNFNISVGIHNESEIGILAYRFDRMIQEIRRLIVTLEREHAQKRKAELETLQAQVTPHFLYNSLNAIRSMARIRKAPDIEEMSSALIGLLQLSISKDTVYITIREEIEIVRQYLALQNYRFGHKIQVIYRLEEDVLEHRTLKMILQPIVENAIFHGIDAASGRGVIEIGARRLGEHILMTVRDNGTGMSEEQIQALLRGHHRNKKRFSGIGIKNAIERIRLHFGEAYGITIESIQDQSTVVSVCIPAKFHGGEEQYAQLADRG